MRPLLHPLIITPGDPRGIGAEVCVKALKYFLKNEIKCPPFLFIGNQNALKKYGLPIVALNEKSDLSLEKYNYELKKNNHRSCIFLIPTPIKKRTGGAFSLPGYQSGWSIEKAVSLIRGGISNALITGPIHKESLIKGGYPYTGHTDLLTELSHSKSSTMMLANESLRVSLVTTHLPMKDVSTNLTKRNIISTTLNTVNYLKKNLKIRRPIITICALNPHGGEGGVLGFEEVKTIVPAVEKLTRMLKKTVLINGPLPADSAFAINARLPKNERADAFICMYHDQALIPLKLFDFNRSVNITLGLPFIRTSVDHGVGFDIAGKNKANPESMIAAINLARALVKS